MMKGIVERVLYACARICPPLCDKVKISLDPLANLFFLHFRVIEKKYHPSPVKGILPDPEGVERKLIVECRCWLDADFPGEPFFHIAGFRECGKYKECTLTGRRQVHPQERSGPLFRSFDGTWQAHHVFLLVVGICVLPVRQYMNCGQI